MSSYNDMMYAFGEPLLTLLNRVPDSVQDQVQEIRLRLGLPLALTVHGNTFFVRRDGNLSCLFEADCYITTQQDLAQTVSRLCERSMYSFESQVRKGYLSLQNGCRAGIGGCYYDGDRFSVRDFTSVNIRIAHSVKGCADEIFQALDRRPHNVLLVGPPGSGKTTLLRDLVRSYSHAGYRVGVADERGELAAMRQSDRGLRGFDLGECVDVLTDVNKKFAVQAILKYFNPQILVFDELSDDADSLQACMTSGVCFMSTFHSDSAEHALQRLERLRIDQSLFDILAVLDSEGVGKVKEIRRLGDSYEVDRHSVDIVCPGHSGMVKISGITQAS